jgi:hypothetical protein
MTKTKKKALALFAALAWGWGGERVWAALTPTATLDLVATFNTSLSVKIDGLQYSTRTMSGLTQGQTVVPSSGTVTNDSSLTEKWSLTAADVTGNWTLVATTGTGTTSGTQAAGTGCQGATPSGTCPGLDQFALQALFISSDAAAACPSAVTTDWDLVASTVSAVPQTFGKLQFADTKAGVACVAGEACGNPDTAGGTGDGDMLSQVLGGGVGVRGLCVRLMAPQSVNVAGATAQTIALTITAGPGT